MLHRLIGGRSVIGVMLPVLLALPIVLFLSGWDFGTTSPPIHWLMGETGISLIVSWILVVVVLVATAFVTRFQINRGSFSQAKGSHHLMLIPLFACLASPIESFFQVASACIVAVSFLMMDSTTHQEKRIDPVFHSGIVLGVGVVLVPDFIWAFVPLLLVMLRIGKIAWRNWSAMILGAVFPLVVLWTTALIFDFHEGLPSAFLSGFKTENGSWKIQKLVFPTLVLIASIAGFTASFPPLTVRDKVTLHAFGIWLVGVAVLAGIDLINVGVALISLSIPAAVFTSRWFECVNRKWIVDLVYVGMVVNLLI